MTHTFDLSIKGFSPSIDLASAQIESFSLGGEVFETDTMRDLYLKVVQHYYKTNKWAMREVMIKKHGFLQAYFYQDVIGARNPLNVIDNIYMRQISMERAFDLLVKTLEYMKEEDFQIITK